ncbi:cryptochrome/photolyase family protein [Marinobacterium marinum]|uniref:Deoxyribodipyrimidine photo-lyase n=1 Tax=Marinobacterium marinum TaxID=2756129 RepID=A0A7W1WW55_9GAMM|nr:FAD-binding domain-containing protein [Marinobacterium marinum]MBA4501316.1 deoxyribodipyrimidine photo-lyase [Marinobacterium marinum]
MQLVWLRNDLRLVDNPALSAACATGEPVMVVVCLTPAQWAAHNESAARINYWQARLEWLERQLSAGGIEVRRLMLEYFADCPPAILQQAKALRANAVHFNYEYPLNEQQRDRAACQLLAAEGIVARGHHGDLIIPPGRVMTGQGTPFKVFTPFSRAWMRVLLQVLHDPLPAPVGASVEPQAGSALPWPLVGEQATPYPVADSQLSAQLYRFVHEREPDYRRWRDFPARHATSGLSAALTIGALSARQCLAALKQAASADEWQQSTWLNELIWREFYRHLLVAFPDLSRLAPFRPEVEARIGWLNNDAAFAAWKVGETGFPIVDAAMKQLLATGWMHNRLRMIVASFLTKLLRVDWRHGEAYFMSKLIDGDFASNLGGWQWSASVGADAAPYFRIFNPRLQSEKFDPDGEYLATWLPELRQLSPQARHEPGAGQAYGRPAPIIDYRQARQAALDDYNG